MNSHDYDEMYDLQSIIDKIDHLEKVILSKVKKAPDFLILDRMSYGQLKYERGIDDDFPEYHGYTIAIIPSEFEEIIRFV